MRTSESLEARWFQLAHPRALLQPGDKTLRERATDSLHILHERPDSGRLGALGRKVERPSDDKPSGPSGQTSRVKHESKHSNR